MAKRTRGNGEGSIYLRKDGRWAGQYLVYTSEGPKYRYIYGKTRAQVSKELTKAIADRDGGLVFEAGSLTVGEYVDKWLWEAVKDTVRASTFERHEQIIRLHIKPVLGRVKLKSLSPIHVQSFYRDRLDSGLSPAMVNKVHVVLHKALSQALRWHMVPRNVTEMVKAPWPAPKEMLPLSPDEARRLLEAARGDHLEALYVLAVQTGMRQGELLGLKWEDVDLEEGIVRIKRTLIRIRGSLSLGEPKTKRSRRSVRLTSTAVQALRKHLGRQMEDMEHLGDLYRDQGLIFTTQTGTLINPTNLRKRSFVPLLQRAGIPHIRFHDLRHTCATLLLSRNTHPKYVQELLGHATIAITLDIYSHVLPGMGNQTAAAMEVLFS